MAESMTRAGFDEATVQGWLCDQPMPEWIIKPSEPIETDEDDE